VRSTYRRRGILGLLILGLCAALLAAASFWGGLAAAAAAPDGPAAGGPPSAASASPSPSPSPVPLVQTIVVSYSAWNGTALAATLVLPLDYSAENATPLPCIVQPHGRGSRPAYAASLWGDLPTRYGFAVICPDAVGEDGTANSWAAPGQIDDVVRMPDTVEAAVPWVRFDRRRLYLVGSSMGGQESLVGLARAPDHFAAVAAFDGAADLAARYRDMGAAGQRGDQAKLRHELQGVPAQRRFAYQQRSPLSFCRTLATCGVPLRIAWSTADQIVTRGADTQFGRLCRRLRAVAPEVPLTEVISALPHGQALPADPMAVVDFLAPDGVWRTRQERAPETWAYAGWQQSVDVWGCRIAVPGATGSRWWRVSMTGDTISVTTPEYMRLSLPWSGEVAARVVVNGRARRVSPRDGRLTLAFLAGQSVAVIQP
jgi:pimeloyl-ACP methyl ester carboxylesterase